MAEGLTETVAHRITDLHAVSPIGGPILTQV